MIFDALIFLHPDREDHLDFLRRLDLRRLWFGFQIGLRDSKRKRQGEGLRVFDFGLRERKRDVSKRVFIIEGDNVTANLSPVQSWIDLKQESVSA